MSAHALTPEQRERLRCINRHLAHYGPARLYHWAQGQEFHLGHGGRVFATLEDAEDAFPAAIHQPDRGLERER